MRLLSLLLMCLAAPAAEAEIAPGYLEGDFDGDGRGETVGLYDNEDGGTADLFIMSGDGNTVYDPALVLARGDAIAAVGRTGELVTLAESPSGSILLSYGRRAAQKTLTIAFRQNAFRVIGFIQVDRSTGWSCDLNLLTGRGELMVGGQKTTFKSREMRALPISEWKEIDVALPGDCM
jgi:hypothetical protein